MSPADRACRKRCERMGALLGDHQPVYEYTDDWGHKRFEEAWTTAAMLPALERKLREKLERLAARIAEVLEEK